MKSSRKKHPIKKECLTNFAQKYMKSSRKKHPIEEECLTNFALKIYESCIANKKIKISNETSAHR